MNTGLPNINPQNIQWDEYNYYGTAVDTVTNETYSFFKEYGSDDIWWTVYDDWESLNRLNPNVNDANGNEIDMRPGIDTDGETHAENLLHDAIH